MKLIDLLVQELPKRVGWPEGAYECYMHTEGSVVAYFYDVNGNGNLGAVSLETVDIEFEGSDDDGFGVTKEEYEAALSAAQQPAWNGEGLPPVGCEFEHSFHADGFSSWHWRKCTALGKHRVLCVDKDDFELYLNDTNNKFRPIRSEADKKRDAVGEAIYRAINWNHKGDIERNSRFEDYCKVYDAISAGKIPHIRIE